MSDRALVEQARAGDARGLEELWKRHYRSGVRVARQYTSRAVDELVAQAFVQCYQGLAGRELAGAFRPRLYAQIRAVADDAGELLPHASAASASLASGAALARTLTARAYDSLPESWRAVLWYLEVEGLDPHEAAPLLGMTANATADLSRYARAGMRGAWLRVAANDAETDGRGQCAWTVARLGQFSSHALDASDCDRLTTHLAQCARCSMVNRQLADVASRLALVLIPLVLGADAGGRYLGLFGAARTTASAPSEIPPMPELATALT